MSQKVILVALNLCFLLQGTLGFLAPVSRTAEHIEVQTVATPQISIENLRDTTNTNQEYDLAKFENLKESVLPNHDLVAGDGEENFRESESFSSLLMSYDSIEKDSQLPLDQPSSIMANFLESWEKLVFVAGIPFAFFAQQKFQRTQENMEAMQEKLAEQEREFNEAKIAKAVEDKKKSEEKEQRRLDLEAKIKEAKEEEERLARNAAEAEKKKEEEEKVKKEKAKIKADQEEKARQERMKEEEKRQSLAREAEMKAAEEEKQQRLAKEAEMKAEQEKQERLVKEAEMKAAEEEKQQRLAKEAEMKAEQEKQERLVREAEMKAAEEEKQQRLAKEAEMQAEQEKQERLVKEAEMKAAEEEKQQRLAKENEVKAAAEEEKQLESAKITTFPIPPEISEEMLEMKNEKTKKEDISGKSSSSTPTRNPAVVERLLIDELNSMTIPQLKEFIRKKDGKGQKTSLKSNFKKKDYVEAALTILREKGLDASLAELQKKKAKAVNKGFGK